MANASILFFSQVIFFILLDERRRQKAREHRIRERKIAVYAATNIDSLNQY